MMAPPPFGAINAMESFQQALQVLMVQLPPFFIAVIFHEFAHGWVAYRWGDKTAFEHGRLTLNPVPHVDPIGTVLFPVITMLTGTSLLFGWAKPVPIDPRRFKRFRPGLFWVSFAGPGMNFLLATLAAAAFCAIRRWMPVDFFFFEPLLAMCFIAVSLNYALGIFNLLPLPPLDGSKIIESFLPLQWARQYESVARYSFFILIGLMMTGAFRLLSAPIEFLSSNTLILMARVFGLAEVL